MTLKNAVVTGAGQGTGRAIALELASKGLHVVLVGRTASKLESVAAEISADGGTATVAPMDVTDDAAVDALAATLGDQAVDVLVNCAGDWLIEPFGTTSAAQLDHILNVNLRAPYRLRQALLPHLRRSQNASVINIGSMAAVGSYPGITAYTAAKTGLRGLTGSLAAELRSELIRVVMLSPSPTNTPMRDAASPGMDKSMLIEPATVAAVVWMIVSLPQGITPGDIFLQSQRLEM